MGGICNYDDHDKNGYGNWAEIDINIFYFGLLAITAMSVDLPVNVTRISVYDQEDAEEVAQMVQDGQPLDQMRKVLHFAILQSNEGK